MRPEDVNTPPNELPQNDELYLAEGEHLDLYLVLVAAQQSTFLVTALVDYQQTPFTLDGQFGLLHEIDQEAEGDLYVPIQIEVSGPGAHDLILIAFKNPYDRPVDHDARFVSPCLFTGRRTVVIVGDDRRPARTVQPDAVGIAPPSGVDWGTALLFAKPGDTHPSRPEGQLRMISPGKLNTPETKFL
ncbi:MAG: hypothetical protein JW934_12055 [Anaerolineae bacterium]|nr:hypothetical protein [Anaerolineae bacterium]